MFCIPLPRKLGNGFDVSSPTCLSFQQFRLPCEVAVASSNFTKVKELDIIEDDDMILDIGPKTIKKIKNIINSSKTILWNGPAGYFENPNFARGSHEIAKEIVKKNKDNSIFSVVGGGDTIALINQINLAEEFNFVSTAGGGFLEYLEGKELPGIKSLN